jgi:cytochrome c-type biogenesis protein CcmH/NrfG
MRSLNSRGRTTRSATAQATLATLDSAQRMAHRLGFKSEEAEDLTLLGDAFAQAGDYRHALDHYARALAGT